ncbi:hypothetical protein ZWY2020_001848 [Hordeum vulgare]|nr:hypothetical protein ZWY2020_001848 [Hordeum vulgare]
MAPPRRHRRPGRLRQRAPRVQRLLAGLGGAGGGVRQMASGRASTWRPRPGSLSASGRKMVLAKAAGGGGPRRPPLGGSRGAAAKVMEQVFGGLGNLPVSSKAEKFPARSGFGTIGRRCRVRANHCRNNNTRKSEAQMKTNQKKK